MVSLEKNPKTVDIFKLDYQNFIGRNSKGEFFGLFGKFWKYTEEKLTVDMTRYRHFFFLIRKNRSYVERIIVARRYKKLFDVDVCVKDELKEWSTKEKKKRDFDEMNTFQMKFVGTSYWPKHWN